MANEVKVHDPTITITIGGITVNLDPTDDQVMVASQAGGASGRFFQRVTTAISPAWGAAINFGFTTQGIMLKNEGDEEVEVSFDGMTVDSVLGTSGAPDAGKTFDNRHELKVYLRSTTGGKLVEVEAW